MIEVILVVLLLVALFDKRSPEQVKKDADGFQERYRQMKAETKQQDVVVNAYDMNLYMQENNIRAYFCSHENRIYWVQNVEETMFCPNDSTLLYAC